MKKILTIAAAGLLSCYAVTVTAQGKYIPATNIPVTVLGTTLKNPWVGGYNAPIFSEIDMNGDGRKDLFVFEKDGNRISTYINQGTPNTVDYIYAPQYSTKFPKGLHDWVLLKDFNCDGKEDIFTYSYSGGMTVYRNDYSASNGLKFNLAYNLVNSKYGPVTANLYVASVNLPALVDVDYDGDLDVLTFPVSGNFVEYHENKGVELFNKCDTLVYQMNPSCFGNFGLSGLSNTGILNVGCRMAEPQPPVIDLENLHTMHSGSCMISVDIDGDYDKDIINGDILGSNLLLLINGGDSTQANMTTQDSAYPSYDTSVDLITFPSPYYLDVNNDGNKDLVVAPCISASAENFNNVWFYINTTDNNSNVFNYQQNRLFVEDMVEVGAGANVSFEDIDSDGLKDMIIGNYGYFNQTPPFESGLAFFRNVGSATSPAFEQQTIDYGNFFSLALTGLDPAFGDVDADGDKDLMLGNTDGTILYYTNTAGQGNFPVYVLTQPELLNSTGAPIDVGQFSSPQLIDVNKDGKIDLLIGERTGTINYYENTGSATIPAFSFVTATFGNVNVNTSQTIYGYSNPCLHDSAGTYQLLVGSISGYIYQYQNIDGNLNGTFTLVDSMYYGIHEPDRATVDVADIDNDGRNEILVGNNAGGVALYKWDNSSGVDEPVFNAVSFTIYPNPASSEVYIRFDSPVLTERTITIVDVLGQVVDKTTSSLNVVGFNSNAYAKGVYICQVVEGNSVFTKKFVVK